MKIYLDRTFRIAFRSKSFRTLLFSTLSAGWNGIEKHKTLEMWKTCSLEWSTDEYIWNLAEPKRAPTWMNTAKKEKWFGQVFHGFGKTLKASSVSSIKTRFTKVGVGDGVWVVWPDPWPHPYLTPWGSILMATKWPSRMTSETDLTNGRFPPAIFQNLVNVPSQGCYSSSIRLQQVSQVSIYLQQAIQQIAHTIITNQVHFLSR